MLCYQKNSGRFCNGLLSSVFWCISLFYLTACDQGSTSVTVNSPEATVRFQDGNDLQDDNDLQVTLDEEPLTEDSLAPLVNAGLDQFADANVVIAITGSAVTQGEASIAAIQWQQISGPEIQLADTGAFSNIIHVPDSLVPEQAILSLQVTDSEGRMSEDFVVISILPLDSFVRVVSGSVNEDAGAGTLRVELNEPLENDIFLTYKSTDGSALAGVDYIPVEGEKVIKAGETSFELAIELIDDAIQEADETLLLQVSAENGDVRRTGIGSLIIRNGDDSIVAELLEQFIAFKDAGPVTGGVGELVNNPILDDPETAPGSGEILYSSSNPLVATVDENSGEATLLAAGTTVITAFKAEDNLYASAKASYNLEVSLQTREIAFEENGPLSGFVNESFTNPVNPSPGTGAVSYESADPDIASVNATSGEVTLLKAGTALITATKAADATYAEAQASYEVVVELQPQTLSFENPGPLDVTAGDSFTNLVNPSPGTGAVSYESADPDIASVNATSGEVTLLKAGTALIRATKVADSTYAEATASYEIIVSLRDQTISFESNELFVFVGQALDNPLADEGEGSGAITYTSSDPDVATVDLITGTVSGVEFGSAEITASKAADDIYNAAKAAYVVLVDEGG